METLKVERERFKEPQYMSLYKDLLRRNRGLLQLQREEDREDFAEEAALLKEAAASQQQVWAAGIGIGLLCFASLHYLPNYLIRRLGGEAKVKAFNLAEQQARKDGTAWMRKATGLLVEGSFSVWAGYCAFHRAADLGGDTYELIAKVPLCAGRSAVAEGLCDEWINITNEQIPDTFWLNVRDGILKDERAWNAIRSFSNNCVRRRQYEAYMRQRDGTLDRTNPIVLPRKVPEYNDANTKHMDQISRKEAEKIVTDRK